MCTCLCLFCHGSLGTLAYITFRREGQHKTKSSCKLNKWKPTGAVGCCFLPKASRQLVQHLPHQHHTWEQNRDPDNRKAEQQPSLAPLGPQQTLSRALLQTEIYYIYFALCFHAFDSSNLFILVFVGLTVRLYNKSLLLNPIWLYLDIPV